MRNVVIALTLLAALISAERGHAAAPRFTTISVNTDKDKLVLFYGDESGKPFKRFDRLAAWLAGRKQTLRFAMNAGMYHADFAPVGLLVIDGKELAPLNLDGGAGNFFLKPNGVFLVGKAGPRIVESSEYPALAAGVQLATQSGPLLLRNGKIHSRFNPEGTSRHIRNGIGTAGNKVYLVISEEPVNLYDFAAYFRDTLGCRDALYLDGSVSTLFQPAQNRTGQASDLGPMIGVIE